MCTRAVQNSNGHKDVIRGKHHVLTEDRGYILIENVQLLSVSSEFGYLCEGVTDLLFCPLS